VGPPKRPVRWAHDAFSPRAKRPCRGLTTELYLMPRLRITGSIPPLPHMRSWAAQGAPLVVRDCVHFLFQKLIHRYYVCGSSNSGVCLMVEECGCVVGN